MAEWIHPLITLLCATYLGMMTIKRENKDTANLKNKMDPYTKKQTIDATQQAGTQPRVRPLCPAVCLPLRENRNWKCYLLGVGEASLCDAKGSGKAFRTHEQRTNLLPVHCSECYGPHGQKDGAEPWNQMQNQAAVWIHSLSSHSSYQRLCFSFELVFLFF